MDPPDTDLLFRRLLTRPGAIPKEWIMNPQFEELSNVFLRRAAVEYGLTKVISGEPDGDAAEADNLESFKRSNHMQAYMAVIDPNGTMDNIRFNAHRLLGVIQKFHQHKASRQAMAIQTSQPWAGKFAKDLPAANYAGQLSHYKTVIDGGGAAVAHPEAA